MNKINCNNCKHINITEEYQQKSKDKPNHICLKYKVRVIHRSNNPKIIHNYIYPCNECDGKDFEERRIN